MKRFRKEEVGEVLQRLYDSGISIYIDCFADDGFDVKLPSEVLTFPTFIIDNDMDSRKIEDAVSVLANGAALQYPESEFNDWYKSLK
jgi:hypothetical protein